MNFLPEHADLQLNVNVSCRLAANDEDEDDSQWKLYFKLYCFLDVESMPKEGVEFAFMFEQVSFSPTLRVFLTACCRPC